MIFIVGIHIYYVHISIVIIVWFVLLGGSGRKAQNWTAVGLQTQWLGWILILCLLLISHVLT